MDRRPVYLGRYGSPESLVAYEHEVERWREERGAAVSGPETEPGWTVGHLMIAYYDYARSEYAPATLSNIRQMISTLRVVAQNIPIDGFGLEHMTAYRQLLIADGLAAATIRQRLGWAKHMMHWGARKSLAPGVKWVRRELLAELHAMEKLREGRGGVPITRRVMPVSDEVVRRTLKFAPRTVRAMIIVQRLTGMRPGELREMRIEDIDRSGEVWVYSPYRHKAAHLGKQRLIHIGPRAAKVIARHVGERESGVVFATKFGRAYTKDAYSRAVARAARLAYPLAGGMDEEAAERTRRQWWHPHQLRHARATEVRDRSGLDAAQAVLGHARVTTTQVYAQIAASRSAKEAKRDG